MSPWAAPPLNQKVFAHKKEFLELPEEWNPA